MNKLYAFILFVCVAPAAAGCSAVDMKSCPEYVSVNKIVHVLSGKISYNGNVDYIPRVISDSQNGVSIDYKIDVRYGASEVEGDFIRALIPTSLVGMPVGSKVVTCYGVVDVVCTDGRQIKYVAAAIVNMRTNIFEGSDLTLVRRNGLLSVRDNLESQMSKETALLSKCMNITE